MQAIGLPFARGVLWSVSVEEQLLRLALRGALWDPIRHDFAGLPTLDRLIGGQLVLLRRGTPVGALRFNSLVRGGTIAMGILSPLLPDYRTPRIHRYARGAMFFVALLCGALRAVGEGPALHCPSRWR
jgi:hypothetical protein